MESEERAHPQEGIDKYARQATTPRVRATSPQPPARLVAAAYHVAAQAVAAHHLREPFTRAVITLDQKGDTTGYVVFRGLCRSFQRLNNRGVVLVSGVLAQRRHKPSFVQTHLVASDQRTIEFCASRAAKSPAMEQALIALWEARAGEFVRSEWGCIARVAASLLERGTLATGAVTAAMLSSGREQLAGL